MRKQEGNLGRSGMAILLGAERRRLVIIFCIIIEINLVLCCGYLAKMTGTYLTQFFSYK